MRMKRFFGKLVRVYNKIIHSNLFLQILSLILGIVVWFSIINVVNPQNETVVSVPVEINMEGSIPEHYGLSVLTTETEPLYATVRIAGSRTNIFAFNSSEIKAEVDLSSVTESGGYSLNINVTSTDDNLEIVSVEPSTVFLEFDRIITRSFDVNLNFEGEVADGYVMTESQVYPRTVDISGPQSVINNIKEVYIPVNISGKTEGVTATSDIIIVNEDGNLTDRTFLTISSENVSYSYNIYYRKTVPLTIDRRNNISGDESSYTTVEIIPETVTIGGTKSVLDEITEVKIETPIALESITGSSQSYVFNLPENENYVYLDNQEMTASVTVSFDSAVRTRIYTLSRSAIENFAFVNLPEGMTATIASSSIQIPIRSLSSYLNMLSSSDITGTIDFSQTNDSGQYLVNIQINEEMPYGVTQRIYVDVDLS